MKQIGLGLLIGVLCVLLYNKYTEPIEKTTKIEGSQVIQEQLKNVSKLIVSEGHFSDVITYTDVKSLYMDLLNAEKKAVVLVKAKAFVSYNLREIEFLVNEEAKEIVISNIPKEELQVNPELNYYDLQQDYLNPFKGEDYNKISILVNERLQKQIAQSTFISNSKNRLVSELYALFSKTPLKGWTITEKNEAYTSDLIFSKNAIPQ